MDLTLDSKDLLLETLSQGSHTSRSPQPTGLSSAMTHNSQTNQGRAARLPHLSAASSANTSYSNSHVIMDEAFKRLGQRLSLQAHGDDASSMQSVRLQQKLEPNCHSAFQCYEALDGAGQSCHETLPSISATTDASLDSEQKVLHQQHPQHRTRKVAKTNYSDHGAHCQSFSQQQSRKRHLLRRLTMDAHALFRQWQESQIHADLSLHQQRQQQHEAISAQLLPSHQTSLQQSSSMSLDGEDSSSYNLLTSLQQSHFLSQSRRHNPYSNLNVVNGSTTTSNHLQKKTGLLSAVMESQNESTPSIRQGGNSPSGSISTKESAFSGPSLQHYQQSQHSMPLSTATVAQQESYRQSYDSTATAPMAPPSVARGVCLTQPCEGVHNDGLDNIDGNLIVYQHDILRIPKQSLHTLDELNDLDPNATRSNAVSNNTLVRSGHGGPVNEQRQAPDDSRKSTHNRIQSSTIEFRIESSLGQGTFAQVFECVQLPTNERYALKVVKNKPAYTRQATVEIDVFRSLQQDRVPRDYMVALKFFFMYKSHLCLVFEKLGSNLYEVLKKRQFRGLPLSVVRSIVRQIIAGVKDLTHNHIVHCDLKPENILLETEVMTQAIVDIGDAARSYPVPATKKRDENTLESEIPDASAQQHSHLSKVKIIDFGSACFEGYTAHTYIQSRFYRCPEVLIGLPYDSGIDMWSLGCVAAELYLGLPILPGCHEHDQLGRIQEMIGSIPDWMLDQGTKSTRYYVKYRPNVTPVSERGSPMQNNGSMNRTPSPWTPVACASPTAPPLPQWRLKTQQEYINSLSQNEISKKGGLAKLEKQPGHRYFKSEKLVDIIAQHSLSRPGENKELLAAFTHFLYCILDPDPWKRLTALQVSQHPFLTGDTQELRKFEPNKSVDSKEENQANIILGLYWQVPWDPAILRRKLLNVQRQREKQQSHRRTMSHRTPQMSDVNIKGSHGRSKVGSSTVLDSHFQAQTRVNDQHATPPSQIIHGETFIPPRVSEIKPVNRVGPLSSSLSNLGGPSTAYSAFGVDNTAEVLAPPGQVGIVMGPQSVGRHDDVRRVPMVAGDFAFALQRPGIVPGVGSISGVESDTPFGSFQPTGRDPNDSLHYNGKDMGNLRLSRHKTSDYERHSLMSAQLSLSSERSFCPNQDTMASNASANIALSRGTCGAHSVAPLHEGFPHQSQEMLQTQQHPHQRLAAQPQIFQTQPLQLQQHQSQMHGLASGQPTMVQQSLIPVNDVAGRLYYVTTSITGQPILLQPVGSSDIVTNLQMPFGGSNQLNTNISSSSSGQLQMKQHGQLSHPSLTVPTSDAYNAPSNFVAGSYAPSFMQTHGLTNTPMAIPLQIDQRQQPYRHTEYHQNSGAASSQHVPYHQKQNGFHARGTSM